MATPDFPKLQRGVNFRLLLGDGATPTEAFALVCLATTHKFSRALDTDDVMLQDCANPDNLPTRQSVPKGKTWDVSGSGRSDFAKFKALEAVFNAGLARNIQIAKMGTGANGGGVYLGAGLITSLEEDKNDNGLVTFSFAIKGQGELVYTANA